MEIAIADIDGRVGLYCYHNGVDEDGYIHFHVINGAWDGKFKDDTVYVNYTQASYPGYLVWAGSAKGKDYNEAIMNIQETIDDPEYNMIPLETVLDYKYVPDVDDYVSDDDEVPF